MVLNKFGKPKEMLIELHESIRSLTRKIRHHLHLDKYYYLKPEDMVLNHLKNRMKILHYSTKDGINWSMISNKKTPLIYLKYQIFMIQ